MSHHSLDRIPETDQIFARLLVQQRITTEDRVAECVSTLARLHEAGVQPLPSLGELLVRKGYLSLADVQQTLRLSHAHSVARPVNLSASQEFEIPPEALGGERIGKYIKVRKLGAGGMGEVWQAWDAELRRWVALKFMKGHDAEEIARFRREAQMAASLSHPNIGAVYEAHDDYIAMQLIEGVDLKAFPRDDHRALAEVMRQAALAVHFAHEHRVIHRDIKPANIMVRGGAKPPTTRRMPRVPSAPKVQAFVLDFGLAKSMSIDSGLSVSGFFLGTPQYASPEQAQGSTQLDHHTDVYALGATLYELLTDRPPFEDPNPYKILRAVVEQDPVPVRKLKLRVEEDLETITMKCLEKDPSRRYATASELADDLARWLGGEAILAHPPSTTYRFRKWIVRHKGLVTAAGFTVVAIVLGSMVGISQWARARKAGLEKQWEADARQGAESKKREAEAKKREVDLFAPTERDLAILTMRFYQPGFRLTDKDFAEYEAIGERVMAQMNKTGQSAWGWWLIGRCREVHQRGRAQDAYDAALKIDSRHAPSLLRKGRLFLEQALITHPNGEDDEARRERFVDLVKEGAEWVKKGLAFAEQKELMDTDLATAYLTVVQGLEVRTSSYPWQEMLAKWNREPLVEEFLLLEAKLKRDLEFTEMAISRAPSYPAARFWHGVGCDANGNFDEAIADSTQAIEINPRYAEAYNLRGISRKHKGDSLVKSQRLEEAQSELNRAIADYTTAIEINSRFDGAYLNCGNAHSAKGDIYAITGHSAEARVEWKRAITDYTQTIEIDPRHAGAYTNCGIALEKMGDLEGAIANHTHALEINPHFGLAYSNRGTARKRKGDLDGAIEDQTKAIESNPQYAVSYYNRGNTYLSKGDLDAAIADYTSAININPQFAEAYTNRGTTQHKKGDLERAIEDHTRAIEINPAHAGAYINRGNARLQKDDIDGAIRDYEKALQAAPANWLHRENARRLLDSAQRMKNKKP